MYRSSDYDMRAVAVLVDGRKVSGRRQDGHLERSEVSEGALDVVGLEGELARLGRRQQAGVLQRRRRGAQPQLGRRTGRPAARLAAAAVATAAAVVAVAVQRRDALRHQEPFPFNFHFIPPPSLVCYKHFMRKAHLSIHFEDLFSFQFLLALTVFFLEFKAVRFCVKKRLRFRVCFGKSTLFFIHCPLGYRISIQYDIISYSISVQWYTRLFLITID